MDGNPERVGEFNRYTLANPFGVTLHFKDCFDPGRCPGLRLANPFGVTLHFKDCFDPGHCPGLRLANPFGVKKEWSTPSGFKKTGQRTTDYGQLTTDN
jgi:hypothetical protein